MKRQSGVLLPVSALPGRYGIGSFGRETEKFIDIIASAGFGVWQTLPLCLPDECHSPYKSFGAFSGNPYFIDLDLLCADGLITEEELECAVQTTPYSCEYERLDRERMPLLAKAAERYGETEKMDEFYKSHPILLEFCHFMARKKANGGLPFYLQTSQNEDADELRTWKFAEYIFFEQWQKIRNYANERGVKIIGDIPIYVADDSSDVCDHPENFLLDTDKRPVKVAGVPPDYFSAEGQLWGNPLYNWKKMKEDGYSWWRSRIRFMSEMFDGVRIDHFRAFDSYYAIPAGDKNALNGMWESGPGLEFLLEMKKEAGDTLLIAEDLGDITESVRKLVEDSTCPGMRVIQFAFLGDSSSPHLPHNYINNCVAYTGTHDNNTLLGYVWDLDDGQRRRLFSYCGYEGEKWDSTEAYRCIIRTLFASAAGLVIMPVQDLLLYGNDTRINIPGKPDGNWRYRVTEDQLADIDIDYFKKLNSIYARD